MKIRYRRYVSVFLLVSTVWLVFQPTVSYALTHGPHQPEYTSYEEPGAKDMVNLLTGDFTFNLPLLEVPGPEGSFSLPLTYHAGIGMEQESSWVGLGWTMNAGAITRQINQYPDDASGEIQSITIKDLTGVRGWTSSLAGFGQAGWDSNEGSYGSVGFTSLVRYSWSKDYKDVNLGGIHIGTNGLELRVSELLNTVSAISDPVGFALQEFGQQMIRLSVGGMIPSAPSFSSANGYWEYSRESRQHFTHKDYWIWLDQTRNEKMFGVSNLDKATPLFLDFNTKYLEFRDIVFNKTQYEQILFSINGSDYDKEAKISYFDNNNTGSASDINYYIPKNGFQLATSAATLATDRFSVNALNISGLILPYRLDIGSVSMPLGIYQSHYRLMPVPYSTYKVPFIYKGSLSSNYLNHTGNKTPIFNYGIDYKVETDYNFNDVSERVKLILNDSIFTKSRITNFIKSNNYKIPQANHIEWMSNTEIGAQTGGYTNGFMDCFSTTSTPARSNFRNSYSFYAASSKSAASIGGFSITGVGGITYHFALPVYDYNQKTQVNQANDNGTVNEDKFSTITRNDPFANTWLLTGITGPDFVDRNTNGVIDTEDWGYWVKFNYGKSTSNYHWRLPFSGYQLSSDAKSLSYTEGYKELYYLNSIETRSHVAVFIKDTKSDGNDADLKQGTLSLNEIALLRRMDYESIIGNTNSANTDYLWMASTTNSKILQFRQKTLKRIAFTYDSSLSQQTANSTYDNKGKLTLKRVSILNNTGDKILPDYKFDYNTANPSYNKDQADAWGMYNPSLTSRSTNRQASNTDEDGSAWSLSTITTPQGSTVNITYERDTYSSVSGIPATYSLSPYQFKNATADFVPTYGIKMITIPEYSTYGKLKVGDEVTISVAVTAQNITPYSCLNTPQNIYGTGTISSILGNNISFVNTIKTDFCPGHGLVTWNLDGTIQKQPGYLKGDGIRVASISLRDQSQTYKTRYLYTNDTGNTSGVIAQEPDYAKTIDKDFGEIPHYPITPILYGQVSVLTGALTSDYDYATKHVYQFETPNVNMFTFNSDVTQFYGFPSQSSSTFSQIFSIKREISDHSLSIGSLKSIKIYDHDAICITSTNLKYTSELINKGNINNYQGIFSEGTLMVDCIIWPKLYKTARDGSIIPIWSISTHKITRSTILHYPYTLLGITTVNQDGYTMTTENKAWDYVSGQVLEKLTISSLGQRTYSVTVPAYSVGAYAQMGPKALNVSNKNMLAQTAAQYTYKVDPFNNITGLIDANVTTWKSDWSNYRDLNTTGTQYSTGTGTPNTPIWRVRSNYAYIGNIADRQADGTLKFDNTKKFDFGVGSTNSSWLKTNEVKRYDHYSLPVETYDPIHKIYASMKTDNTNKLVLATGSNATYFEFAYSGAEDLKTKTSNKDYFGGEISIQDGTIATGVPGQMTHTGSQAVQVSGTGKAFVYKPDTLSTNRVYRAQVWTKNPSSGAIYYKVAGVEQTAMANTTDVANGWYRILVDFIVPSGGYTTVEVGVKSVDGSQVLFDDFRFQPRDGSLQGNVYDATTGFLTYTLGDDNLYTRYEYDSKGVLTKTYIESIKYNGERLVTEKRYDYKRFYKD